MISVNRFGWTRCLLACATLIPAVAVAEPLPSGLALHFDFDQVENHEVPNLEGPAPDAPI